MRKLTMVQTLLLLLVGLVSGSIRCPCRRDLRPSEIGRRRICGHLSATTETRLDTPRAGRPVDVHAGDFPEVRPAEATHWWANATVTTRAPRDRPRSTFTSARE